MTAVLVLWNDAMKAKAVDWINRAPKETRVTFKGPKRTLPQNDKLHAMLTELAEQRQHHGMKLSVSDWKLIFLDALHREVRMVPNLDNTGFVNLTRSTTDLSVAEMGDMIELINAYGAEHGIVLSEGKP